MKATLLILVIFVFTSGSLSALRNNKDIIVRPDINVEFASEISEIARGYEEAFKKLPTGPRYVLTQDGDEIQYFEGSIRSIEAFGGVLLITSESGPSYVISARKVFSITNKKPAK